MPLHTLASFPKTSLQPPTFLTLFLEAQLAAFPPTQCSPSQMYRPRWIVVDGGLVHHTASELQPCLPLSVSSAGCSVAAK